MTATLSQIEQTLKAVEARLQQLRSVASRNALLSGVGTPSAGTGADGDFYIDTVADAIFGPKTAGAWGTATSLIGPPGTNGLSMGQTLLAPASGAFLSNSANGTALSTVAQAANRNTIAPYIPRHAVTIDQLGCSISTLLAASTVKLVLYDSDALGRPTTLLRETVPIDSATTGTKLAAISPLNLEAGKTYWLGLRASGTQSIRTLGAGAAPVLAVTNAATPVLQMSLTITETYAAAAANWTYANSQLSNLAPPLILMRVA